MFKMSFEVVEVYPSGVRVTHRLCGKRKDVKKDIEMFKSKSKDYKMFGKIGMIVWVA